MNEDARHATLSILARLMALTCVRNTKLEDIHAGIVPVSHTGDYSDAAVVDADGRRIPWPRVSHFDDGAMRDLMREVADRLYTFHAKIDDPRFQAMLGLWESDARAWDEPKLDADFMAAIGARGDADGDEA